MAEQSEPRGDLTAHRRSPEESSFSWLRAPCELFLKVLGVFFLVLIFLSLLKDRGIVDLSRGFSLGGGGMVLEVNGTDLAITGEEFVAMVAKVEASEQQITEMNARIKTLMKGERQFEMSRMTVGDAVPPMVVAPAPGLAGQGEVTAPLVTIAPRKGTGAIWLGTFDPVRDVWTEDSTLRDAPPPDALRADTALTLKSSANLRLGIPPDDDLYYSGVPRIGVIETGETVRLIGTPTAYTRGEGQQYWGMVEATYTPTLTGVLEGKAN
ncbi:hypothetical protein ACMA5I_12770 [Paracoccaceae bacterium GXU_MW_L88]